jgi:hypothetical protein
MNPKENADVFSIINFTDAYTYRTIYGRMKDAYHNIIMKEVLIFYSK